MPLKPEYKQKTLDALRSGDYVQAFHTLKRNSALCCIGVAAVVNGYKPWFFTGELEELEYDTWQCSDYIGLTDREQKKWVAWNDEQGLNFNQIADLIEQYY